MKLETEFPILMKLNNSNEVEFRHQLQATMKRIASKKDLNEFVRLLDQFKKEFINHSFFYLDDINEVIKNLTYNKNLNFAQHYKQFSFIAQIGDTYTSELLQKILSSMKDAHARTDLENEIDKMNDRLNRLEARSEEFNLYPMVDILDQWVD